MYNETPLPSYLQQHEVTKRRLTNFSQLPNAAESLQMTMSLYPMSGASISSNKPLMVFTGGDPEYSEEDYLNAVTANLILIVGPEPVNTPLHQNWIHRRTALIQTTLDGAAQSWFSVLPIEIKSDWKKFTQEFSKMFDLERIKKHQRVFCNKVRRLPNETIEQLVVRIETLVRKAYSINNHVHKNTKMAEILMMTLTPQLQKKVIKKRASLPSSIREPDLDFRKLVDKLEQAEITMKLEETENLKLQFVNNIQTTTSQINNINDSDTELFEKISEVLNIYEKNPKFKDDEEYYTQTHQQFYSNQKPRSYNIDQTDIFEPYIRDEQVKQIRINPTSQRKNKFQQQNPVNTQSKQPTQMYNENPLPSYLQQHEVTKIQLTDFLKFQMPQNQ